jgi:pantoate--beta-alanine ligase
MRLVETLPELRRLRHALILAAVQRGELKQSPRPLVGLVPTMGALHEGHNSLLLQMRDECDVRIASIFVNPLQFGAGEDLDRYPRSFEADCAMCEAAGVELLWFPAPTEMYPPGYQTTVKAGPLAERWCGAQRPGHFDGVATVVAKLFSQCGPDRSYFGEKDFQQLQIVRRMACDLNLRVEVVACPTRREADGLAMSSRNRYLNALERSLAPRLHEGLVAMQGAFRSGERRPPALVAAGANTLRAWESAQMQLEYLSIVDPASLEPRMDEAQVKDRVLIAARVGAARLIDNEELSDAG